MRSYGGTQISSISPPIPLGRGASRSTPKMLNINLSYDGLLRLLKSGSRAGDDLADMTENSAAHKQGVNLVVNFESGRVDFVAVDKRSNN